MKKHERDELSGLQSSDGTLPRDRTIDWENDPIIKPPPPEELSLMAHGCPESGVNLLFAMRVLGAIARDPRVPLTIGALSEKSGLSVYTIQRLIQSKEWDHLFTKQLKGEIKQMIARASHGMDRMMMKHPDSPEIYGQALSKLTTAFRTLHQADRDDAGEEGEKNCLELLAELEKTGSVRRINVEIKDGET